MKHCSILLTLAFLLLILSSCIKQEELSFEPVIIQLNENGQKLVESSGDFGIALFKAINSSENNNKNLMISPYSISLVLAMTYNGANGNTKTAMENAMLLNGLTVDEININYKQISDALLSVDPLVNLSIANSIWYRDYFLVLPSFIDVNTNFYNAEVNALDFDSPGSIDIINTWVANKTNNRIKQIVDQISPETVMFLINAIYFKGPWKYEFDKAQNYSQAFQLSDATVKQVEMMTQTTDLASFSNSTMSMVQLPYGQGNWVMDLILPVEGKTITDVVNELSSVSWNSWVSSLNSPSELNISLPPFKFEYSKTLNDILSDLGMAVAFDPSEADFSKINESQELYISKVQHKTFVEVNEEGTEAAAVASVEIIRTSPGPSLIFNRPFLFVIREISTGTILFIGKLENPE